MSGHSKWHNIQKTKGAQDAKRAAAFTKIQMTTSNERSTRRLGPEIPKTMKKLYMKVTDRPALLSSLKR